MEGHKQSLSLSCEARSAVDWAAYWGVKIGEKKFLARLPRSKNPDKGFVGNLNDTWGNVPPASYGVHAPPAAELLQAYGLQAEARRDMSWEDLQVGIAAGRPVIEPPEYRNQNHNEPDDDEHREPLVCWINFPTSGHGSTFR